MSKFKQAVTTAIIALTVVGTSLAPAQQVHAYTSNPDPYYQDQWNRGYSPAGWDHYYSQYIIYNNSFGSAAWTTSWAGDSGWVRANYGYAEADIYSFGPGNWGYGKYYLSNPSVIY